jgi:hypothetical protein
VLSELSGALRIAHPRFRYSLQCPLLILKSAVLTFYHLQQIDGYYDGRWVRLHIQNGDNSFGVPAKSQSAYRREVPPPSQPVPQTTTLTTPRCNQKFFLRFERPERITDIQMSGLEFFDGSLDELDSQLWQGLTPSDYARLKDGFRIKFWRKPNWILKEIIPHHGDQAAAQWRYILHSVVDGDVLWLAPVPQANGSDSQHQDRPSMISTPRVDQTIFIRCQSSDRVTELQMNILDFLQGSLNDLDFQLWQGLTPSHYARLRDGFRLRIWRKPNWFIKEIKPNKMELAESQLRAIGNAVFHHDVLWLEPLHPAQ